MPTTVPPENYPRTAYLDGRPKRSERQSILNENDTASNTLKAPLTDQIAKALIQPPGSQLLKPAGIVLFGQMVG